MQQLITLKLTMEEIRLLASLASDELFRREFVDRRLPGYRPKPGELESGKALVERLRLTANEASQDAPSPAAAKRGAFQTPSKRSVRIPNSL